MTRQKNDTQDGNESQATFEAMLREQLQQAETSSLLVLSRLLSAHNCTALSSGMKQGEKGIKRLRQRSGAP